MSDSQSEDSKVKDELPKLAPPAAVLRVSPAIPPRHSIETAEVATAPSISSSSTSTRRANPERKRKHKEIELRRRTRMRQHYDELNRLSAPPDTSVGMAASTTSLARAPRTPSGMREKDDILVNAINRIKALETKVAQYEKMIFSPSASSTPEGTGIAATPARTIVVAPHTFHPADSAAATPTGTSTTITTYPYSPFPQFPPSAFARVAPTPSSAQFFPQAFFAPAPSFLPASAPPSLASFGSPPPVRSIPHISGSPTVIADRSGVYATSFHELHHGGAAISLSNPALLSGSLSSPAPGTVYRSASSPFAALPQHKPPPS